MVIQQVVIFFKMKCCSSIILPAVPLSPVTNLTTSGPITRRFKLGDADPIIKQHAVQWLICMETYKDQRANQLYGWVLLYGDPESCLYRRGCNVIAAFRGTHAPKDLYDDTKISFGQVYPRAAQAIGYIEQLTSLNPDVKVFVTGHSLGGAIARDVGKALGLNIVTFNAASPPSRPVESGSNEIDYHIVFDVISAWQQPNTVRIEKGYKPATQVWGVIAPYISVLDVFGSMIPAHSLSNFSNSTPGITVSAKHEDEKMQRWFLALPMKMRSYVLITLVGTGGAFLTSIPNLY
jgi:Lipase (class 3)